MGTWGVGLFDGDAQLDFVGSLSYPLEDRVAAFSSSPATAESAGELAATIGLLLQLSSYCFVEETRSAAIVAAVEHHEAVLDGLGAEAAALLRRVAAGEGEALSQRTEADAELTQVLGRSMVRDAPLFAHAVAGPMVQAIADACCEHLEEGLQEEDMWEIGDPLAGLGVLLVIAPCSVSTERIAGWRDKVDGIWKQTRQERGDDGDVEFFAEYMVNVDKAFDRAEAKFA